MMSIDLDKLYLAFVHPSFGWNKYRIFLPQMLGIGMIFQPQVRRRFLRTFPSSYLFLWFALKKKERRFQASVDLTASLMV